MDSGLNYDLPTRVQRQLFGEQLRSNVELEGAGALLRLPLILAHGFG